MIYNSIFEQYGTTIPDSVEATSLNDKLQEGTDIPQIGILPPCHISFSSFALDFDLFNMKADPLNLKLFKKIEDFGNNIKLINNLLIEMIGELHCCDIADGYNNTILPFFEYILNDFLKEIVKLAELFLKFYQVYSVIVCIVRPVPGNPWNKSAGFDFLQEFYSLLEGFDSMFKWIVNGNIMDILLDPVKNISDKLKSCSPVKFSKYKKLIDNTTSGWLNQSTADALSDNNKITLDKVHNSFLENNIAPIKNTNLCECLFSMTNSINTLFYDIKNIYTNSQLESLYNEVLWKNKDQYKTLYEAQSDDINDIILSNINIYDNINLGNYPIEKDYSFLNQIEIEDSSDKTISSINVQLQSNAYLEAYQNQISLISFDTIKSNILDNWPENDLRQYTNISITEDLFQKSNPDEILTVESQLQLNQKREELKIVLNLLSDYRITQINIIRSKIRIIYDKLKQENINIRNNALLSIHYNQTSGDNLTVANNILESIGYSFDINKTIIYLLDNGTDDDIKLINEYTLNCDNYDILIASVNRLTIINKVDHCSIKIIGRNSDLCDCSIVCKIIQMIVDTLLARLKAIIESTINNLKNSIINEKIAFIIKFILDKYKCILNAQMINEYSDRITEYSNILYDKFKLDYHGQTNNDGEQIKDIIGLNRMYDISCELPNNVASSYSLTTNQIPVTYINEDDLNIYNTSTIDTYQPNIDLSTVKIIGQQSSYTNIPIVEIRCDEDSDILSSIEILTVNTEVLSNEEILDNV